MLGGQASALAEAAGHGGTADTPAVTTAHGWRCPKRSFTNHCRPRSLPITESLQKRHKSWQLHLPCSEMPPLATLVASNSATRLPVWFLGPSPL